MHLIQLFLPLYDNEGAELPRQVFADVRSELVERFGGLTAYSRAPAEGLWADEAPRGRVVRDDIVIYEVMAEELDGDWWAQYKCELCARLRQTEMIIRVQPCVLL